VAAVLSAPGAAGNSAGFSDETAEGSVGPDIARVEVSNDDAGNVTFRILLANGASLAANQGIWLSLDTDENPATGGYIMGVGRGGFDYALDTGRPVAPRLCTRMQEVGGTFGGFMALDPGSLRCSYPAPGVVVFQINRSDLGASNGVNLVAVGEVYDAAQSRSLFGDQAPGCGVTWNYKIYIGSSPPPPAPQPCTTPPPPPPPPPPPSPRNTTIVLSPTRTSVPVSVPVKTPIVDLTVTASKPLVGLDLVKLMNVPAGRTSSSSSSGLTPALRITKHRSARKVTVHVTGVKAGTLRFRVKAKRVPRRTGLKVTVRQRYK